MKELAIVVPCINEADNLEILLPRLHTVAASLHIDYEITIIDGGSTDGTSEVAEENGARAIAQRGQGYGGALKTAFEDTDSRFVITLDADLSHHPAIVGFLYRARRQAEVLIASRYAKNGFAQMPIGRKFLSWVLNGVFRNMLSMPVGDMSSGFRLYHRSVLDSIEIKHPTYAVLQELLIKSYCKGFRIAEAPFHYRPRRHGSSHARVFKFGRDYLSVLWEMWHLRNCVESADYDTRAFYSRIPFQRWWQRKRYAIITDWIGERLNVLDVGCGSTQILEGAPQSIGLDIQLQKLRYMRRPGRGLVNGSIMQLPFKDESFEVVVCSQVIEHIPKDKAVLDELTRLVKPGGRLILGTPDYGSWQWPMLEKMYDFFKPLGYAEEHISHYTRDELKSLMREAGLDVRGCRTICEGEMVVLGAKPRTDEESQV
ncbi:MAG: glycosyltransferase [Candidatus Sumerlaeota bacterium]